MDHVPHMYPEGQYEDQSHANTLLYQRSVEVHCPVLLIDDHRWCLDLGPFRDEVSQHLGLDCHSRGIHDALIHQLELPLGGSSHGVLALDDLA